jgi:hypothetical protein
MDLVAHCGSSSAGEVLYLGRRLILISRLPNLRLPDCHHPIHTAADVRGDTEGGGGGARRTSGRIKPMVGTEQNGHDHDACPACCGGAATSASVTSSRRSSRVTTTCAGSPASSAARSGRQRPDSGRHPAISVRASHLLGPHVAESLVGDAVASGSRVPHPTRRKHIQRGSDHAHPTMRPSWGRCGARAVLASRASYGSHHPPGHVETQAEVPIFNTLLRVNPHKLMGGRYEYA